jgi:midasin (ATPase involved in ribosome maturation)
LKKIIKKSHGKHCNNSQCFKEKNYKAKFLISSILKTKLTETILEKKNNKTNTKKKKKYHVGNTVAIHSVL